MNLQDRLAAFLQLKNILKDYEQRKEKTAFHSVLDAAIDAARLENPWFTEDSILSAIRGVVCMLEEDKLSSWIGKYNFATEAKTVACILAGNIPLVGFHDFLCVVLSGHCFVGKMSSKDSKLLFALSRILIEIEPRFQQQIQFVENLKDLNYDAVIATGSTNTSRYFEQYFSAKPNIIRKGRSSVALLSGLETPKELEGLADDIFMYFGLGCRNVSKLYIPKGFDVRNILPHLEKYAFYKGHSKWMNNYDYNRSINLVNQNDFYETGFALFMQNEAKLSPISVIYYEEYEDLAELKASLSMSKDQLQCVVSNLEGDNFIPLGKAQFPDVDDYADGVDTLKFLQSL